MKDKIYIIGAGAIGKALAVFLKLNNKNVVIVRGRVDDTPTYTEEISVIYDKTQSLKAEIEITTINNITLFDGIVVLTNKSYGNEQLAQKLKNKIGNSPIVLLQNGLGVEQVFIENDFPEIYRCVLFATSQISTENELSFKPVTVCPIGIVKGGENLKIVVDAINSQFLQFRAEGNIQPIIWKKAIANIVFNSICPLLEIDNGVFHRNKQVLELAKKVIAECIDISEKRGIILSFEEVLESVLLISKLSDGQLISTLQDINNKRETEIKSLNFEMVNIAKSLNMEQYVAKTLLLGELTLLKSGLKN